MKVGDKVRWPRHEDLCEVWELRGSRATITSATEYRGSGNSLWVVPVADLTLVESAPSEPGKSTDLLYGWERCSHEGIGKPGCSTCDPDKSRCVAKLERDLAQRDATIAELRKQVDALNIEVECHYSEAEIAKLETDLRAARAKSEQRREALEALMGNHNVTWADCVGTEWAAYKAAISDDAPPKAEAAPKTKVPTWDELVAERDAPKAEVERLKNERAVIDDRVMNGEAENAKLREALQRCAAQLADWCDASEVKYPGDRKALDMAAALGVKVTS